MEVYDSHKHWFLADRTNGRAYSALLRPSAWRQSVVYLSVVCNICIVAKRCVLEQKLLLTAHIGSRMSGIYCYQNELPWTLFRGGLRSRRPVPHIRHWIWRKMLEIEAGSKGLPIENGLCRVKWSCDRQCCVILKCQTDSWPQYA